MRSYFTGVFHKPPAYGFDIDSTCLEIIWN